MDFQTGPSPWRFLAEMVCKLANFKNGSRLSIDRFTNSRWYESTASHLLTANTTARPLSKIKPAMWASCSVTPCVASNSNKTTLADSMACKVLTTENFSMASNTLPLRRKPAVSMSSNFCPSRSKGTVMASRVVPGMSKATKRSSPSQVLMRVDLPTLGRPATASLTTLRSGSASASSSGKSSGSRASSTKLRMP